MGAGRKRHRITIVRVADQLGDAEDPDTLSDPLTTETVVAERWAEILPGPAREVVVGDVVQTILSHRLRIAGSGLEIRTKDRVRLASLFRGGVDRTLEIVGITPVDNRRIEVDLDCVEAP